jgi:hypothetical protein
MEAWQQELAASILNQTAFGELISDSHAEKLRPLLRSANKFLYRNFALTPF